MRSREIAKKIETAALIVMIIASGGRVFDIWGPEVISHNAFSAIMFVAVGLWLSAANYGYGYDRGRSNADDQGADE